MNMNNMASNLTDLCRLCASKDEFSKDLLDENNKNILKIIQDFMHIFVFENDSLPTRICLNCEDKMISFQLFVLECYKVQDTLRRMYKNTLGDLGIKLELQTSIDIDNSSGIKSEVKDEMTTEDMVTTFKNEESLTEFNSYDYEDDDHNEPHNNDKDYDDDYLDKIAIAALKQIKSQEIKSTVECKVETGNPNDILQTCNFKVKDLVKFECVLCEQSFKTWPNIQGHYAKDHKCDPIVLCLCGFEITSQSSLYKHVSEHKLESKKLNKTVESEDEKQDQNNEKYLKLSVKHFVKFICRECERECSSWFSLKAHCQRAHKIAPIVECCCGVTFKSKSGMYQHLKDHKNPNVLACDKCPRVAKTVAALYKHKMSHVPKSERKYICESCNKIFKTKVAIKSHLISHIPIEDRKKYHCEVCNLKFTTRSSVASHKRVVHDKIKGYVCDLCGYACGTAGELKQHRAIHSDDKPFVCKMCSKPFKTYSNLKTHMDTHEETSYECVTCGRVLNSRRTLRKHLLMHGDKCQYVRTCNKAFKRLQTSKSDNMKNDGVAVSVPVAKNEVEAM